MNIEWLYMTKTVAKREGFTHHGSYFGIPCWIDERDFCVATKWVWMEPLMSAFHYIEQALRAMQGYEPAFQFLLKEPIE